MLHICLQMSLLLLMILSMKKNPNSTVNSMVLFSCRLLGWTLVERVSWSVVLALEISGERPFSSRPCRLGKLGSFLNRAGRVPVAELPAAPLPTAPLPSPLDWKLKARFSPSTSPPPFPLSALPKLWSWLNFSMHSSIRAGGAFLWATLTRPQKSTSNFLAKLAGDTAEAEAEEFVVVEREESLAPEITEAWLGKGVMSLLRAELLLACLNVPMISGTWTDGKQSNKTKWVHLELQQIKLLNSCNC